MRGSSKFLSSNWSLIQVASAAQETYLRIFVESVQMEHTVRISAKDNALSKRDQSPSGKILVGCFAARSRASAKSGNFHGEQGRSREAKLIMANNLKFAAGKLRTLVIELGVLILV